MLKALHALGCVLGVAAIQLTPLSMQAAAASEPGNSMPGICAIDHVGAGVIDAQQADFPEIARNMGATGTTYVKVDLAANGGVVNTSIFQTSGNAFLDRAALVAARRSSFRPEIRDCSPVDGTYLFAADFIP
ncbi:MAG: hypothetical protein NVSMB5_12670 [Candidatus Velthaea sp.]